MIQIALLQSLVADRDQQAGVNEFHRVADLAGGKEFDIANDGKRIIEPQQQRSAIG
ncbi:hypothetical protein P9761_27420 [Brevibacillus centrosporus]|uniref:hypothetical protein n=1 Tax=Brevibacillus centrosporus TaxID=54910 RepID=UPI0015803C2F|nr:hypothetical protein [Brevibacillus centrosporus]MEC2132154.1 hypothetical protein [Brevibacillus centrosporus]MED4911898.1 hypothetical protein [Brevibacillus centrosporus]